MIQLTRDRRKSKIARGLQGEGRVKKSLNVLELKRELGDIPSKKFKSSQWKPAKKQLRAESNDKCAYCEADTKIVAHGDVEHFRPKGVYWWLAYCYDNYLYSCQICNQTFKSNNFPVSGSRMRGPRVGRTTTDARLNTLAKTLTPDPFETKKRQTLTSFIRKVKKEKADLIDPYVLDPEEFLIWKVDDDEKKVFAKIKPGVKHRAAKQKALDELYGLNREELCKVRYQDYETVRVLAEAFKRFPKTDPIRPTIKAQLDQMIGADRRFAGMTRYFVKKRWKIK